MGDTECLMQIQMAHIRADVPGPTEPHLRIQVGAIHIDLPAVCMDDLTDAPHIRLEDTVSRGVGQHERREPIAMLRGLGFKIG